MRLLRVRVDDFRGIDAYEVRFAEGGVTVVEAPNESGKSSMLEAVDLLFNYKDTSRAQAVKDVSPVGRDVGSFVEVELRCGDHHLTCRKRFNRETMTELEIHAPEVEQLTGDEAHDRLRALLETEVDMALFEALWFRQGRSLESVGLAASSDLAAALDEEAGGTAGGSEDALLERVRDEFEGYFTPTGKEGKPLSEIDQAVEQAEARLEELQGHLDRVEADVEELEQLEVRRAQLEEDLDELGPKLAEHRERLDEISTLRDKVETRQANVAAAESREQKVAGELETRRSLVEQVDGLAGEVDELEEKVEPQRERVEELDARLKDLKSALREADEGLVEARARTAEQQRIVDLLRRREEQQRLAARLERLEAIQQRRGAAEAFLEDCALTDQILAEIRGADDDLRRARSKLEAGAPTLRARALRELSISVDGDDRDLPVDEWETIVVEEQASIVVPDAITIEVTAGTSLEQLRAEVDGARRRLEDACQRGGVEDLDDAARTGEQRRAHEQALEETVSSLEEILDGSSAEELRDQHRLASSRIDELEREIDDVPEGVGLGAADEVLAEVREQEQQASDAVDAARTEHDALKEELDGIREQYLADKVRLDGKREDLERVQERLGGAREEQSDEALDESSSAAMKQLEEARTALEAAELELDELDPETVELLAKNVTEQLERTEKDLRDVQDRRLKLQTKLEVAGEEGLGEQVAQAADELERLRTDQRRIRTRAEARKLLYEELLKAREEAYRAYRAPLREGIVRLAKVVFGPDIDVTLDEELAVVERRLGTETLPWESLSSGAREQLAVLTALAATQLAADSGAPLILDDTLGYTDPARLQRIGAVLNAVEDGQVIVLTCVADRFRNVGGAKVVRLREATPGSATDV